MLQVTRFILSVMLLAIVQQSFCQVMTEDEVVKIALGKYPSLKIAELEVIKQKSLEKTAFNPDQPRFTIETPTDAGLGFEIEQEFDFPTVYAKRSSWLKSKTEFTKVLAHLSREELIRDVKLAYLQAQFSQAIFLQYKSQDSLWREISNKSKRLFDAGEINKADLLFAQKHSALIWISLENARMEAQNRIAVLKKYVSEGISAVSPLEIARLNRDHEQLFLYGNYKEKLLAVENNNLQLMKAHRAPGLIIGYVRSSEPDTEYRNRLKAGITVPIWQNQYKGEVEAARVTIEQSTAEAELIYNEGLNEYRMWENILNTTSSALSIEFNTVLLPRTKELTDTYLRLYEAGEIDYALTLRNLSDSFEVTRQYLETIKLHNEAVIHLTYYHNTNYYD